MYYLRPPSVAILSSVFFSVALVSSAAFSGFAGLNFETCRSDTDCKGDRSCLVVESENVVPCSSTSINCFCRPVFPPECTSSSQCDEGEICFGVSRNVCSSCSNVAQFYPGVGTLVDDLSRCAGLGVTGDFCKSENACASPRACFELDPFIKCTFGKTTCYCIPETGSLTDCTSCTDCSSALGEGCFKLLPTFSPICLTETRFKYSSNHSRVGAECAVLSVPTTSSEAPTFTPESPTLPSASFSSFPSIDVPDPPISPSASYSQLPSTSIFPPLVSLPPVPSPAIMSPAPCIAVQHLTHLTSTDLVFSAHRLAAVLCDAFGSCATTGHIVLFKGRAMCMRRYCTLKDVQCVERRMHVNNPRMRRARRVKSMTRGLEFSVFAARYESWAEETILRAVIAAGM